MGRLARQIRKQCLQGDLEEGEKGGEAKLEWWVGELLKQMEDKTEGEAERVEK